MKLKKEARNLTFPRKQKLRATAFRAKGGTLYRTKVVGKRFAKNRAERPFFAISAAVPLGGRGGAMTYKSTSALRGSA